MYRLPSLLTSSELSSASAPSVRAKQPSAPERGDSFFDEISLRYKQLNANQRKLANTLIRQIDGVPFKEVLKHSDWATLRRLAELQIIFLLPNPEAPETVAVPLEYRFLFTHLDQPIGGLLRTLMSYPEQTLRAMAEFRGFKPVSNRYSLGADLYWTIRNGCAQEAGNISMEEAIVLDTVLSQDNSMEINDAAAEFLENNHPAHRFNLSGQSLIQQTAAWPKTPLGSLLAKGFLCSDGLAPGPTISRWNYDDFLFVPTEILPSIRAVLRAKLQTVEIAPSNEPVPAPETVFSRAEDWWRDAWRIEVACYSLPVEITQGRTVNRNSLKKLSALLKINEAAAEAVISYLVYHRALSSLNRRLFPSQRMVDEPAAFFRELMIDHNRTLRDVLSAKKGKTRNSALWNVPYGNALIRDSLLELLWAKNPAWVRIEDAAGFILADKTKQSLLRQQFYWLGSKGSFALRKELLSRMKGEVSSLFYAGLLDRDETGGVLKASSTLAHAVEGVGPPVMDEIFNDEDAPPPVLVVQPNLEVIAPPGTPFETHRCLGLFGNLTSIDRAAIYSFSLQSLHRGLEQEQSLNILTQMLTPGGTKLPAAFQTLFEEAGGRSGELLFMPCTYVVRAARPHLRKILETAGKVKPIEGTSDLYLLDIDAYDLVELLKQLKKKGFFPIVRKS